MFGGRALRRRGRAQEKGPEGSRIGIGKKNKSGKDVVLIRG